MKLKRAIYSNLGRIPNQKLLKYFHLLYCQSHFYNYNFTTFNLLFQEKKFSGEFLLFFIWDKICGTTLPSRRTCPAQSGAFKKKHISVIYLACLQYYLTLDIFKLRWTTLDSVKIQIKSEITLDLAGQNAGLSGVTAGSLCGLALAFCSYNFE